MSLTPAVPRLLTVRKHFLVPGLEVGVVVNLVLN